MAKAHQVPISISDLLSETHFEFAIKCLKNVMHIKKSENFVFSPYSIYEGLLLTYFASKEDTELWLKRILLYENFPPKMYLLHDVAKKMGKKLPNCYEKNSCWITNSNGCVNKKTELLFTDELKAVPFDKNSNNLKKWINKLLSLKTQKYIHKPVKLDIIGKNMEIILTTVLGFTGMACQKTVADNESNHVHDTRMTHLVKERLVKERLVKEPRTVLSHNLGMLVTELPYVNKTLSLFLLFPAAPDLTTEKWRINEDITGLIERLTNGAIELRGVLDNKKSSTVQLSEDMIHPDLFEQLPEDKILCPDIFELEDELPINQLLEMLDIQQLLEPDKANLTDFIMDKNLHLGGAKHRAHIKMTRSDVTAGAISMFFTKNEASFKSFVQTDRSNCKNTFICLLYCKYRRTILFIGVVNKLCPLPSSNNKLVHAFSSFFNFLK